MVNQPESITYTLTRTSKKNVNITIKNDGIIYVSAPKSVALSEINRIVTSKSKWITEVQKNIKSKKIIKSTAPVKNGAIVYFYGEPLKLKIIPSVSNSLKVDNGELLFYVKKDYIDDSAYKNSEFSKLLKKQLNKTVDKYINQYLNEMSLNLDSLEIRSMKSRWGTCIPAKKKILMNSNLVHCPKEAIEYVALHEVTHLLHPNHSQRFYDSIAMYMPNYKDRKDILQNYIIK